MYDTCSSSEYRVYVDVTVAFDRTGRMFPRSITWVDGHVYTIDRVLSVKPSFSQKAGGQGDCYTVRIGGSERHLYYERPAQQETSPLYGRWFVEKAN